MSEPTAEGMVAVDVDLDLSERQERAVRTVAAYYNLPYGEAVSLLARAGMRKTARELGAESFEDADPEEVARHFGYSEGEAHE